MPNDRISASLFSILTILVLTVSPTTAQESAYVLRTPSLLPSSALTVSPFTVQGLEAQTLGFRYTFRSSPSFSGIPDRGPGLRVPPGKGTVALSSPQSKPLLRLQIQEIGDRWAGTRQTLETATLVGLWTTGALGTIIALNRPTLLGDGRCLTGDPILGNYGCGELSTVHGMSAVLTTTLYTASQAFNLTTGPDTERSTTERVFTWIHRAGFIALPLLGILSRYPQVIGVNEQDFSRGLRTVHLSLGYVTVFSYTITFSLDSS